MSWRSAGTVTPRSAHIKDYGGKLQFYVRDDEVSARDFEVFKLVDIGDIIGVTGTIFRTKTGELTLRVSSLELLSKAVNPLPEKWHGLQDKELRYRRRYVDLIVNEDVYGTFLKRSRIVEAVRRFLLRGDSSRSRPPSCSRSTAERSRAPS